MKSITVTVASVALFAQTQAKAMTGTNIGGWLVLEPWITPSLFYRFLGNTHSDGVGIDTWTFCEALGPDEGKKVLQAHYDAWVTEDHIKELSEKEIEVVRLPLGDWVMKPYGPYVGCTDGQADKIQWFLDTCQKYNIKVLLDVHGLKDSQNGYDNSGHASDIVWSSETRFRHNGAAHWIGDWNAETQKYDSINYDNINWALDNVQKLMDRWGQHPAVYALEPVNEPWGSTPRDTLYQFYRDVRDIVHGSNPEVKFVFYAYDFSDDWNDLFADDDHNNVVMDTHYYQAWWSAQDNIQAHCGAYWDNFAIADKIKYELWIGEWSLATDACAMWLGGFNDNYVPYVHQCKWVDCPEPYLTGDVAVDIDRTAGKLGPFGNEDSSTPNHGQCPTDSDFWPDSEMTYFGQCIMDVMDRYTQGSFMWTFRNELEPRWNYVQAYDNGWVKREHEGRLFLQ